MIETNKECETKRLALLPIYHQQRPFDDLSATLLGKYVKPLLQNFVHVSLFKEATIPKTKKCRWPKKRYVDEVHRRLRNMISVPLSVASRPHLITLDDIDPDVIITLSAKTINTTYIHPLL